MILNQQPLVAVFESQLDHSIIDQLLNLYEYGPSAGYQHQTSSSNLTTARTSSTFFDRTDQLKEVRSKILSRVKEETGHTYGLEQTESLQLTRYQPGQQYISHHDYFNIAGYENSVEVDRIATVILYLTDGFQGGETYFPMLDMTIPPRQGDLLYFHYVPPYAELTLHAGLPVTKGEKRIATLWVRSERWPVLGSAVDPLVHESFL